MVDRVLGHAQGLPIGICTIRRLSTRGQYVASKDLWLQARVVCILIGEVVT